jgi:hypothetical protein
MALAAADAADRAAQLTALTETLTARLAEEAAALDAGRPADVVASVEETSRLANVYRHEASRVRADPSLIAEAPEAVRAALVRATEAFESALARHARALEAARSVSEGLIRTIAAEVAAARPTGSGYGPGAAPPAADATAVALNRKA